MTIIHYNNSVNTCYVHSTNRSALDNLHGTIRTVYILWRSLGIAGASIIQITINLQMFLVNAYVQY